MSIELISILVLVVIFVIATTLPINMGALAFAAAFLVGVFAAGLSADDIFGGFPGNIFVVLVGVTFLFAIAQANGTVDWLVQLAVRAVRGHLAAIPWIMFAVAAVLTAIGAASPAAVAIIAPIALGFAAQYNISAFLMGLMVVHGAQAGGFSPISVYGVIVNGVVSDAGLPQGEIALFLSSLIFNILIGIAMFVLFGGLALLRSGRVSAAQADERATAQRSSPTADNSSEDEAEKAQEGDRQPDKDADEGLRRLTGQQALTIAGLVALVVLTLVFNLDVGLVAITIAVVLGLFAWQTQREAVEQIPWSVVLLICGVLTYIAVLEEIGTIDYAGNAVASVGWPLLAALLICYVGAIVSAFASSIAVLGATIPLAVPFLLEGSVGAIGMVAALAVASTVVDVSPFSTNGALVVANAQNVDRDVLFRRLLIYGAVVTVAAPLLLWLAFVVLWGG
jgi:di/tricarboxylate transporter